MWTFGGYVIKMQLDIDTEPTFRFTYDSVLDLFLGGLA